MYACSPSAREGCLMNDAELLQVVYVNSSVYVIGTINSIEDSLAYAVLSCYFLTCGEIEERDTLIDFLYFGTREKQVPKKSCAASDTANGRQCPFTLSLRLLRTSRSSLNLAHMMSLGCHAANLTLESAPAFLTSRHEIVKLPACRRDWKIEDTMQYESYLRGHGHLFVG